jgi:hypothetical protein
VVGPVVTAEYHSSPVMPPRDTRELTEWKLLDDAAEGPDALDR